MLRGQGWPEAARRIHRRAGERPAHQNIHSYGKADGETCNLAESAALIGSSSKDDEDQEKVMIPSSTIPTLWLSPPSAGVPSFTNCQVSSGTTKRSKYAAATPPANCASQ